MQYVSMSQARSAETTHEGSDTPKTRPANGENSYPQANR